LASGATAKVIGLAIRQSLLLANRSGPRLISRLIRGLSLTTVPPGANVAAPFDLDQLG